MVQPSNHIVDYYMSDGLNLYASLSESLTLKRLNLIDLHQYFINKFINSSKSKPSTMYLQLQDYVD